MPLNRCLYSSLKIEKLDHGVLVSSWGLGGPKRGRQCHRMYNRPCCSENPQPRERCQSESLWSGLRIPHRELSARGFGRMMAPLRHKGPPKPSCRGRIAAIALEGQDQVEVGTPRLRRPCLDLTNRECLVGLSVCHSTIYCNPV